MSLSKAMDVVTALSPGSFVGPRWRFLKMYEKLSIGRRLKRCKWVDIYRSGPKLHTKLRNCIPPVCDISVLSFCR